MTTSHVYRNLHAELTCIVNTSPDQYSAINAMADMWMEELLRSLPVSIEWTCKCVELLILHSSADMRRAVCLSLFPLLVDVVNDNKRDLPIEEEEAGNILSLLSVAAKEVDSSTYIEKSNPLPIASLFGPILVVMSGLKAVGIKNNEMICRMLTLIESLPRIFSDERLVVGLCQEIVAPLLVHKSQRVRISALSVYSRLLFANPWKRTYSLICLLLGRDESSSDIPVADFYAPRIKTNYLAALVFDNNPAVRKITFQTVCDWITKLSDRQDVDVHIAPFFMAGMFDPNASVREFVHSVLKPKIAESSSSEWKLWVTRTCRNFVPALLKGRSNLVEFQNITLENRIQLLYLVATEADMSVLVEHSMGILALIEQAVSLDVSADLRSKMRELRELTETAVGA